MIPARLRRNVLRVAALIFFIVLAGATYQGVATALERREFPRPGGMVKAGAHQLHIHCTGEGSPVVVLEAGATGMSSAWAWVQADVTPVTRVCSYDRAGLGWSEWGQEPFSGEAAARQLQTLLATAGEKPPFVLAGQGFGAALAIMYAARFPNDVHSLVLIDSPVDRAAAGRGDMGRLAPWWPWLARIGALRAMRTLSAQADALPPDAAGALGTFLNRPDHLTRAAIELAAWEDVVGSAAAAQVPPEISVARVEVDGENRVALLTDSTAAAKVSAAILTAVASATH